MAPLAMRSGGGGLPADRGARAGPGDPAPFPRCRPPRLRAARPRRRGQIPAVVVLPREIPTAAVGGIWLTPISSPVNTLVVDPGHYSFGDVRIGVPFSVIVMIVSVLLVPWLLPLR